MKKGTFLVVLTMGAAMIFAGPGALAWQQHGNHGNPHDRDDQYSQGNKHNDRSEAYRDGFRDGEKDRGKKFHPRGNQWKGDAHEAYQSGYRAGFNGGSREWHGDHDRDRDRDDRGRDDHGRWGGVSDRGEHGRDERSTARRFGYDDGYRYGQNDRRKNKSYNDTGSGYYEKATNGYQSNYGNREDYRREYREAYREGYRRGYGR